MQLSKQKVMKYPDYDPLHMRPWSRVHARGMHREHRGERTKVGECTKRGESKGRVPRRQIYLPTVQQCSDMKPEAVGSFCRFIKF